MPTTGEVRVSLICIALLGVDTTPTSSALRRWMMVRGQVSGRARADYMRCVCVSHSPIPIPLSCLLFGEILAPPFLFIFGRLKASEQTPLFRSDGFCRARAKFFPSLSLFFATTTPQRWKYKWESEWGARARARKAFFFFLFAPGVARARTSSLDGLGFFSRARSVASELRKRRARADVGEGV